MGERTEKVVHKEESSKVLKDLLWKNKEGNQLCAHVRMEEKGMTEDEMVGWHH